MKKIIKEDISKSRNAALVYHRTYSIDNIKEITINGFDPGYGAYYGKGFYSFYNDKSLYKNTGYGDIILKCIIVNLRGNFLIFDKNEAEKIYGENCQLEQQIPNLPQVCVDYLLSLKDEFNNYGRILPEKVKNFTDKFNNLLGNQIAGISYSGGKNDGDVMVVYKCKKSDGFLYVKDYKIDGTKDFIKIRYEGEFKNLTIEEYFESLINNKIIFQDIPKELLNKLSSGDIVNLFNQSIEKQTYDDDETSVFYYLYYFIDKLNSEDIVNLWNKGIEKNVDVFYHLYLFKDKLNSEDIINVFNKAIEKNATFVYYLSSFKNKLSSDYILSKFNQAIEKDPNVIGYLKDLKDKLSSKDILDLFNKAIQKNVNVIEYLNNFEDKLSSKGIFDLVNKAIEKDPNVIKYLNNFKNKLTHEEMFNLWDKAKNININENNLLFESYIRNKVKQLLREYK